MEGIDCARFLGTLKIICPPVFPLFPYLIIFLFFFQCFADLTNFPCIADQKDLDKVLLSVLNGIDRTIADSSPDIQGFFFFTDSIVHIVKLQHEARQKEEEAVCPLFILFVVQNPVSLSPFFSRKSVRRMLPCCLPQPLVHINARLR